MHGPLKRIIEASAKMLHHKAKSPAAFETGITTTFTNPTIGVVYFNSYGVTEKKYDFYFDHNLYVGYVKVPGKEDVFLSLIQFRMTDCFVKSVELPLDLGNDFLGLLNRKLFAEEVAQQYMEDVKRSWKERWEKKEGPAQ